jgi:hypothetical protein
MRPELQPYGLDTDWSQHGDEVLRHAEQGPGRFLLPEVGSARNQRACADRGVIRSKPASRLKE